MNEFRTNPEQPSDFHDIKLADELRKLDDPNSTGLLEAAAARIERFDRLSKLLGLLAPAGTAPRTALEQIYQQSAESSVEETPVVLDLQHMLARHWGEWTLALREAEGLPPANT